MDRSRIKQLPLIRLKERREKGYEQSFIDRWAQYIE